MPIIRAKCGEIDANPKPKQDWSAGFYGDELKTQNYANNPNLKCAASAEAQPEPKVKIYQPQIGSHVKSHAESKVASFKRDKQIDEHSTWMGCASG